MQFIASAAFGREGFVKRDLIRLGAGDPMPQKSGGVLFSGDLAMGFAANLWLRTADRVLLLMDRFEARSFEELFQAIKKLPWEKFLPEDAAFPIKAQCARSQLMSPSDCQSIAKKAVVERMKGAYRHEWLPETGAVHQIDVSIHENIVTVALNMSGAALNRRGYRTWNGEAPLRETLAAAMVLSSPWRNKLPLYDPCCGTGTLLIEAAYVALDRAPGLTREFDCEKWPVMPKAEMEKLRAQARIRFGEGLKRPIRIAGSDIDPEAVKLALRHIKQAGLLGRIEIQCMDMRDVTPKGEPGVFLANPPYGERLGDVRVAHAVGRQLGALYERAPGWAMCVMSGDHGFEEVFGKRADKRRRLYNGRLECELLTFNREVREEQTL